MGKSNLARSKHKRMYGAKKINQRVTYIEPEWMKAARKDVKKLREAAEQYETAMKHKKNVEQQIEINQKLIKNSDRKIGFLCASSLYYMAILGTLIISSNTKVKVVATLCGVSTVVFDAVTTTIFNRQEKKLKQQQAFLKQQEKSLG